MPSSSLDRTDIDLDSMSYTMPSFQKEVHDLLALTEMGLDTQELAVDALLRLSKAHPNISIHSLGANFRSALEHEGISLAA